MVVYAGNTSQQRGTNFEKYNYCDVRALTKRLYSCSYIQKYSLPTKTTPLDPSTVTKQWTQPELLYFCHITSTQDLASTKHTTSEQWWLSEGQLCTVICTHTYKLFWQLTVGLGLHFAIKGKGFPYSIPSVGPGADPGVQAVSLQVTVSHPPGSRLPLLSARPAVTSPAAEHPRPLAGTKLYCLVTEAHRCKQLA